MAVIKLSRVGEVLTGFIISEDYTGKGSVELTPGGIAEYIGTRNFGIVYRYLYAIRLSIFFSMKPYEDDPLSVRGPERIFGNVVILGHDNSPRSLTDFEIQCIKDHVTMERYGDDYTVILNDISKDLIDLGASVNV